MVKTNQSKTFIIQSIDAWSAVKVLTLVYALAGLILGVIYAIDRFTGVVTSTGSPAMLWQTFGYWSILAMAVLYAFAGVVSGFFVSIFYNVFAKLVGGIRLRLEEK